MSSFFVPLYMMYCVFAIWQIESATLEQGSHSYHMCLEMAWNSHCSDFTESSKCYITSTPCVASSTADSGEIRCSNFTVDSGYFTRSKPAVSVSSVATQHESFPPLNLDLTEENTGPVCDANSVDQSRIDLSGCRKLVNYECQSTIFDLTNIYPSPDSADQLIISESHSVIVDEQHLVQQFVDIISQLSPCFPHIVSCILSHVSDSDLCR